MDDVLGSLLFFIDYLAAQKSVDQTRLEFTNACRKAKVREEGWEKESRSGSVFVSSHVHSDTRVGDRAETQGAV